MVRIYTPATKSPGKPPPATEKEVTTSSSGAPAAWSLKKTTGQLNNLLAKDAKGETTPEPENKAAPATWAVKKHVPTSPPPESETENKAAPATWAVKHHVTTSPPPESAGSKGVAPASWNLKKANATTAVPVPVPLPTPAIGTDEWLTKSRVEDDKRKERRASGTAVASGAMIDLLQKNLPSEGTGGAPEITSPVVPSFEEVKRRYSFQKPAAPIAVTSRKSITSEISIATNDPVITVSDASAKMEETSPPTLEEVVKLGAVVEKTSQVDSNPSVTEALSFAEVQRRYSTTNKVTPPLVPGRRTSLTKTEEADKSSAACVPIATIAESGVKIESVNSVSAWNRRPSGNSSERRSSETASSVTSTTSVKDSGDEWLAAQRERRASMNK
jgi:hypothetical protein